MSLIHDGKEVDTNENILLNKWKLGCVFGEEKAQTPPLCIFHNTAYALDLLNKHIVEKSRICFHTDVDVDGIGTTYILKRVLENLGSDRHLCLINKDKIHGIQQKHADYFNSKDLIDLMIITDSSSNEIDIIKQFNCDVLCIDHHDLLHNDLFGYCNDGVHRYVIVNNTIDNKNQDIDNKWLNSKNLAAFKNLEDYKGDSDMSCGLVVYELMRIYCLCFYNSKLLENLMLYQWVGVTLLTDAINTLNARNQWYLDKTLFNNDTERTLMLMMQKINKFKASLDKTYVNYSFAPIINKTIRASQSQQALDVVINNPAKIDELTVYDKLQQEAIRKVTDVNIEDSTGIIRTGKRQFNEKAIMLDISKLNIHPNYNGVIASRIGGENNKNAAVYITLENGLCKGSFRGKFKDIDYRKYFADYSEDIYAQGHPPAFGFELRYEQLKYLMDNISSIEPQGEIKPYLTLGNIKPEEYGEYHIDNLDEFKKQGYVWKIATGNAKVTSKDEIVIRVKATDVKLKNTTGKVYFYDVLGLECKSFSPLKGDYFDIYIEYTNEINIYIR